MIQKAEEVCGGSARIQDTRITVRTLILFRQQGMTDAQLLEFYPSISQPDLEKAWEYYKSHLAEIDQEIHDNEDRQ